MQDINSLLDLTLEIEGLLRVLAQRDDDRVRALVQQKTGSLAVALDSMPAAETAPIVPTEPMYVDDEADDEPTDAAPSDAHAPIDDLDGEQPEVDYAPTDADKPIDDLDDGLHEVDYALTDTDKPIDDLDEGFDIDSDFTVDIVEFHENIADADEPTTQSSPTIVAQAQRGPDHAAATQSSPTIVAQAQRGLDHAATTQSSPTIVAQAQRGPDHDTTPQPQAPTTASVPRSFLTLNEKYRFVRELFNNQHALMADVVSKVTEMNSLAEAHDYILNDLNLDEDNPIVIEFLEVITRYFNGRV